MCGFMFLTEEVLMEILSRLPVKSLLRFKCVCKEWKALIENPSFVTKNFNQDSNCTRLLVLYYSQGQETSNLALFHDLKVDNTPPVYEELKLYMKLPIGREDVVGPVNGLFLVHIPAGSGMNDRLALWNPATREWNNLPLPEYDLPASFQPEYPTFGFGLDPWSNDYKIISFRSFLDRNFFMSYMGQIVAVYTSHSGTWRYIDINFDCGFTNSHDVYMRDICYWGMRYGNKCFSILSFDLKNEVFSEISAPNALEEKTDPVVAKYGELLAVLAIDYDDGLCLDVWVVRDDECWIKHLSLGPFPDFNFNIMLWRSNEVLFDAYMSGRLILYNTDNGESMDIGLQGEPTRSWFYSFCYKESLFSLKTR